LENSRFKEKWQLKSKLDFGEAAICAGITASYPTYSGTLSLTKMQIATRMPSSSQRQVFKNSLPHLTFNINGLPSDCLNLPENYVNLSVIRYIISMMNLELGRESM